ncbi:MAG TPA: extracellular solute-binding protein [Alphaproteobacteria bacterium]|nr:extracellular solute-binding protein [Alphaproteobacteria bacterium]
MRRRDFLKSSAAAVAGTAALPLARSAWAADKPEQIVVMTWGGLWGDSIKAGVDAAFEKATGIKVLQDRSSSPVQRITKLRVSLNDQKYDVVQIHDGLVPLAVREGVFEKLDKNSPRLTNLKDVYPRFIQDYWVAQIFSPLGVVYNTKLVKSPPTGFADLWRPEFKNRIVLPDISHSIGPYIIPIGALALGKDPKDEAAGFEMLKKMVALQPIWAKDTDSIMNALRDEEALIGILYKSQTYTVQGWGTPVAWVYPKEGAILYSAGTAIAKNTKNRVWAETYLNLTLDPKIQTIYTEKFNYPGTNRKMVSLLPANLQERVKMSDAEFNRLIELDQAFMADHRAEMTDRWNRIVAGG